MIFPEITDPVFRQAMELPPDDAVTEKILETINTLQGLLGDSRGITLIVPEVTYDLKGTTAGQAVSHRKNGIVTECKIRINNALLYTDHYEDMIQNTVPHEVAHVVTNQLYPYAKSHGREWQYVMRLLGLEPTRCHSYDQVKKARNRTPMDRPYIYGCACREHAMTQIIHRRIQSGRTYRCTECNTDLGFIETRYAI